jgi:hypothetical protein
MTQRTVEELGRLLIRIRAHLRSDQSDTARALDREIVTLLTPPVEADSSLSELLPRATTEPRSSDMHSSNGMDAQHDSSSDQHEQSLAE